MKKEQREKIRRRTIEIRRAISEMDLVSSGTLITRTKACGRVNCRCATGPNAQHGPYYKWNRKIDGRLIHRVITEEQAELVDHAIGNYRQVKELLLEWEEETAKEILKDRAPIKSSKYRKLKTKT